MGGKKKNKKAKKPAVGAPAAGSNNKGAKNAPKKQKNSVSDKNKAKLKEQERLKKQAELKKKQQADLRKKAAQKNEADKKKAEKSSAAEKVRKEKPAKPEKLKKEKTPETAKAKKTPKTEKVRAEKAAGPEKIKKEKAPKPEKVKKEKAPKKEKIRKEKSDVTFKNRIEKIIEKYGMKKIAAVLGFAAAVVVICVIATVLLAGRNYSVPDYVKNAEYKGRTESDAIAFDMNISKNQQALLVKATKAKGDRRAFDFFINDKIVMSEYDDPALIEFGSADGNDCVLMFYIIDENGNELYRSLGVEPGRQITSVSFFDEIPYGVHDVTVAVIGYDAKTFKKVGMQTTQIKLEIGV